MPADPGVYLELCSACSAVVLGRADVSHCPATGRPHVGSGVAYRPLATGEPGTQPGWTRCTRCACLIRADATGQACPAGGVHTPSAKGARLAIRIDTPVAGDEGGWRLCFACSALVHDGGGNVCGPAQDNHDRDPTHAFFLPR